MAQVKNQYFIGSQVSLICLVLRLVSPESPPCMTWGVKIFWVFEPSRMLDNTGSKFTTWKELSQERYIELQMLINYESHCLGL